jgi:hypothetical protein
MKFELERLAKRDNESIITEIKRVAALVPSDSKLTVAKFDEHAKVSSSTVKKRFGGWYKALRAANLAHRYSGRTVSSKMKNQKARYMTDKQLIAELQRVASELHTETLTTPQFNSHSEISASAVSRRLGSWNKALNAAGLRPVNMGRRHTDDDYFENLLSVWTHFGRQPKYREMDSPPSTISSGAYENKWGNWTNALLAFLDRVNSDETEESTQPPQDKQFRRVQQPTPSNENRRKIPLGLRYNVLRRDNFKCVLCGNSPATDPTCKLHVDHVLPFSKNGKTVQDNLRTLCGHCNLGKSDKMETIQPC